MNRPANSKTRIRRRTLLARLACSALPLLAAMPLPAAAATPDIPGYVTTVWRTRDGAPGDIRAMAQTNDGWLWLGTSAGLFRFDGQIFAAHDLLPDDFAGPHVVNDMAASPDGSLWVTYGRGTVVHLAADGVSLTHPEGLPAEGVTGVLVDGSGRALVVAGNALFELSGGRWTPCRAPRWVLPVGPIDTALLDASGAVVVNTPTGLYRLPPGATTFSRVPGAAPSADQFLFNAPDGQVWRTGERGFETIPGVRAGSAYSGSGSSVFAADGRGGFWSLLQGCQALCLRRKGIDPAPKAMADPTLDTFPAGRDGLTTMTLLSDRSGNVWAGGKEGLARFHPTEVKPVDVGYEGYYFGVMPMADGSVLVGTDSNWRGDSLLRFSPQGRLTVAAGVHTNTMGQWSGTSVLVANRSGPLSLLVGDTLVPWSTRPANVETSFIGVLLPDGRGNAWVGVRDKGLFLASAQHWTLLGPQDGFPDRSPVVGESDGAGHAWFGYGDGKVLNVENGRAVENGLQESGLGTVAAILPGNPLVVGGERGVAWFDGKTFRPLTPRLPGVFSGVTGLARTPDGALWANGRAGLVRIDAKALAASVSGENNDLPFRILTDDDGLAGRAQQARGLSSLRVDMSGKLWVAGTVGLATVDPATVHAPSSVHPVILSMRSGNHRALAATGATLPPDDKSIEVTFTGLSLNDPKHIQLRYRLDGADEMWRESEGPGTVKYADLAPGDYRFELQARSSESDWSPVAVSSVVTRSPAFAETPLFRWLIGAACVLVLLAAYQVRIRMLRRRHIERTNAKLAERDRIARELHDSILQGVQAVGIRLSAWEIDASVPEVMRDRIRALSRQMKGIMLEGRARVVALRSVGQGSMSLSDALRLIGEDHEEGSGVAFELVVVGTETALVDTLQVPVLDILREGVHNAFLHAKANKVQVELDFSGTALQARVSDDGRGLPADVRDAGHRPGHWGLVIMRERAKALDARFDIITGSDGTSLTLVLELPAERPVNRMRRQVS